MTGVGFSAGTDFFREPRATGFRAGDIALARRVRRAWVPDLFSGRGAGVETRLAMPLNPGDAACPSAASFF